MAFFSAYSLPLFFRFLYLFSPFLSVLGFFHFVFCPLCFPFHILTDYPFFHSFSASFSSISLSVSLSVSLSRARGRARSLFLNLSICLSNSPSSLPLTLLCLTFLRSLWSLPCPFLHLTGSCLNLMSFYPSFPPLSLSRRPSTTPTVSPRSTASRRARAVVGEDTRELLTVGA